MKRVKSILATSSVIALLAAPVSAQQVGVETLEGGTIIRYLPAYFSEFNAVTVRDVLRRIPGVAELVKDQSGGGGWQPQKRGFGSSGDQILINGKRMSGKSNTIGASLDRMQAAQLEKVEVIRGTAEGLDVRSEGMIINIFLKDTGTGSGSWQAHYWHEGGKSDYDAKVSYSDSFGDVQYQVSAEYGPYNSANTRVRSFEYRDPNGNLVERETDSTDMDNDNITVTASLSSPIGNSGNANLNVLYSDVKERDLRTGDVFGVLGGTESLVESYLLDGQEDGSEFELGGDFDTKLGSGTLSGRFIYSREHEYEFDIRNRNVTCVQSFVEAVERSEELATEKILRGSYKFPLNKNQSLEIGVEGAINTLDGSIALEELEGGVLTPVVITNPDSKVKEKRAEIFATHFWDLSDKVALESALNIEHSKISQIGSDVDNSRTLTFAKPRLELRYDQSKETQIRASIERSVGQLNFGDFISSFDNQDDQIDAGNPNLAPEKEWEIDFTYERRFGDDGGLISVRPFYRHYNDVLDKIALADGSSASGNIGKAKAYGAEIKGSFRFDSIGWKNAVLDISYTLRENSATDPFLGIKRPIGRMEKHRVDATLRQDLPAWGAAYWIEFGWQSKELEYEISRFTTEKRRPEMNLYVQKQVFGNMLLFANWRSFNGGYATRDRNYFGTDIIAGDVSLTQHRRQEWLDEMIIGLRGVF